MSVTSRLRAVATLVAGAAAIAAILVTPSVASAAPAGAAGMTAGPGSRAMWVWDTSAPAATVDLAVRTGIDQLFVAVPPNLATSSQLPAIRALSEQARAADLRVDALGGDPGWVDNPSWVVTYWLKPARSSGLFTGIHVDVEPYSTSAWTTSRPTVVAKYLTLLDRLRTNAGTSPIEADIPFWFHTIPATSSAGAASTLDREIMKRTSGVTVMSYRNTATGADGTLDVATAALTAGAALGKPVRLGQETNYLGPTAVDAKQTFFGWTRSAMETQLAQVDVGATSFSTYAGLAIHDSTGYAAIAG